MKDPFGSSLFGAPSMARFCRVQIPNSPDEGKS